MTFPITSASPVEHDAPLPDNADVVVIGGGIIGVMTALELARKGVSVVLLEKGRIASEQSSRNWGWIRVQGRDPAEIPIMQEAQAAWNDLAQQVDTDIGLRQSGTLYLAKDEAEMASYASWLDVAAPYHLSTRIMSNPDLAQHMPQAQGTWAGALYTPTDMRAEPWVTVPAIARLAAARGVQIIENCAVRLLDIAAGRIAGVITEKGRIKTSTVVLAGGAWSSLLLRRHGISIPQLSVRATVAATAPLPVIYEGGAADHRLAWRKRDDGGYTIGAGGFHELFLGPDAFRAARAFIPQLKQDFASTRFLPASPAGYPDGWCTPRHWSGDSVSPFEKMRILDPTPNQRKVTALARDFAEIFPSLGPIAIKTAWAGMIDTMPDVVPVVDHSASLPGLTICTGMSGHGFGIGPGFGCIAARLAAGDEAGHDLSRFRSGRFSDGTAVQLGPSL